MTRQEILAKGTPESNIPSRLLAMPSIPTALQEYNSGVPSSELPIVIPRNNQDNTQYIVDALKYMPINAKYLSNTTNGFTYNSMADVLLNTAAQNKRWEDHPWMQGVLNPLRIVADTALLWKEKTFDPIAGSIQMANANPNDDVDLWRGIRAGINTAVLNALVDFGNTADILANPIKGLILDGPEGFIKGSIGTSSEGRKQYDYADYIDYGKGFGAGVGELAVSFVAEYFSDPLNWVSFGLGGAIKGAAKTTATKAAAGVSDVLTTLAKKSATVADDIVEEVVEASGRSISKEVAQEILKEVSDDAGKVSSELVERFVKNSDDLLTATVKNSMNAEPKNLTKAFQETAGGLLQSERTRYKSGLFKGVDYTPAVQKYVASTLLNKDLVDAATKHSTVLTLRRAVDIADKTILALGGLTSNITPAVGVYKGVKHLKKHLNNLQVQRLADWLIKNKTTAAEYMVKLDNGYQIDFDKVVEEVKHPNIGVDLLKETDETSTDVLDAYIEVLYAAKENGQKTVAQAQQDALSALNSHIAIKYSDRGLKTYEDYLNYITALSETNPASEQFKLLKLKAEDLLQLLTEDVQNKAVFDRITNSAKLYVMQAVDGVNKFNLTQDDTISSHVKKFIEYRNSKKLYPKSGKQLHPNKGTALDVWRGLQDYEKEVIRKRNKTNKLINDAITGLTEAPEGEKPLADKILEDLPRWLNGVSAERKTYPGGDLGFVEFTNAANRAERHSAKYGFIDDNYPLDEAFGKFDEAYKAYKAAANNLTDSDDIVDAGKSLQSCKKDLIEAYNELSEKVRALTKYDTAELNATNASEIKNSLDVPALDSTSKRTYYTPEELDALEKEGIKPLGLTSPTRQPLPAVAYTETVKLKEQSPTVGYEESYTSEAILEIADLENQLTMYKEMLDDVLNAKSSTLNDSHYDAIVATVDYLKSLKPTDEVKAAIADLDKVLVEGRKIMYREQQLRDVIHATQQILDDIKRDPSSKITYTVLYEPGTTLKKSTRADGVQYTFGGNLDTTPTPPTTGYTKTHVDVYASDVQNFIEELPDYSKVLNDYDNTVDLQDYIDAKAVTYKMQASITSLYNKIVYGGETSETVAEFRDKTIDLEGLAKLGFSKKLDNALIAKSFNTAAIPVPLAFKQYYPDDVWTPEMIDRVKVLVDYAEQLDYVAKRCSITDFNNPHEYAKFLNTHGYNVPEEYIRFATFSKKDTAPAWNSKIILEMREDVEVLNIVTESQTHLTKRHAGLSKIIEDYKNPDSDLSKLLNMEHANAADAITVTCFKNTVERLIGFQQLTDKIQQLCKAYHLDAIHTQKLLDQLVSQINKSQKFLDFQLHDIASEMFTGMNLGYKSSLGLESLSLDSQLPRIANEILNDDTASAEAKQIASDILKTFEDDATHIADVDNDNLWRYIQLDSALFDRVNQIAGAKYRCLLDIETTGTDASDVVYQVAVKVLDADNKEVRVLNYILDPGKKKPAPITLRKLSAGEPETWWTDEVVAKGRPPKEVFTELQEELAALDKDVGIVFIGHNINDFDITRVTNALSDEHSVLKNLLIQSDKLDTLEYLLETNVFELQGNMKNTFITDLATLLASESEAGNLALKSGKGGLFSYADVSNMSELKRMLSEHYTGDSYAFTAKGLDSYVMYLQDVQDLEDAITDVRGLWDEAKRIKVTDTQYTLSKTVVNTDTAIAFLDKFVRAGFIDVPYNTNIMSFCQKYVPFEQVFLNPKTAISYEFENIFDINKIKTVFNGTRVSNKFAEDITHQARKIMATKSWLTDDVIQELYPDAVRFLELLENSDVVNKNYIKFMYNATDDNAATVVATAVYYQNLIKETELTDEVLALKNRFGDISAVKRQLKEANSDYTPTPLLRKINKDGEPVSFYSKTNPKTGIPEEVYAPTNVYSYVEAAKARGVNTLNAITQYNVEANIFHAHTASLNLLHHRGSALATRVENLLIKAADRHNIERQIKSYCDKLTTFNKQELLFRPNRVQAFLDEAKLRFSRVTFTHTSDLDLSDFKEAGVLVYKKALTDNYGNVVYRYSLGVPRELYAKAKDISLDVKIVKNTNLPKVYADTVYEARQIKGAFVHNLGTGYGDPISEALLKQFDAVVPEWFSKALPTVEELKRDGMFDKLRANHTFLWDNNLRTDTGELITTDPFKLLYKNTEEFIVPRHNTVAAYLNLTLNGETSINNKTLFPDALSDAELFKLSKDNTKGVWVYLDPRPQRVWGTTPSGGIVRKIEMVNENSIALARKVNAHYIPYEQYLQLTHAVNTFELPKVVQIISAISTYYKLGYLSSVGFIFRNFIDSNYKNRVTLGDKVSFPKQVEHLFSTIKLLQNYDEVGQHYTKYLGRYFRSDLEYEVFFQYCKHLDDGDLLNTLHKLFPNERLHKRIDGFVKQIDVAFADNKAVLRDLSDKLIDPKLFDLVDKFVNHGPSVGLSRSVINNIANSSDKLSNNQKFVKLLTEDTPLRFVYDTNDMIEQSARLSLYLQELDAGASIDDAVRSVIKTHFDYSDKTLGMLYAEVLFPFMSFSYKNLEFWINAVFENPKVLRELENLLRPCLNYNSLFNPNQEAYAEFDYTFDWSKDVMSFEAQAPWQMINAARLYHILSGNITIDTDKVVRHDNGYVEKDAELYAIFKLSPSVLDAVKMLYNPLEQYEQRLLPPYEVLSNTFLNVLNGEAPLEDLSVNSLLNHLPFVDSVLQRTGAGKGNNVVKRIQDAGLPMAVTSLFTAAYAPVNEHHYWYGPDNEILNPKPRTQYSKPYYTRGGFTPNYSAKRNFTNPYNTRVPTYNMYKLARRTPNKSLYSKPVKANIKNKYTTLLRGRNKDRLIKRRVADRFRHFV